jgi:hypothetical protein
MRSRQGKALVMFALLLPVLLGMVGLVIDCGLLMAAQREAQNAADAAALAAAVASLSQQGDARDAATALAAQYNGLSDATLATFNHPPAAGPHTGSDRHYEVVVTYAVTTLFMPALGASRNQSVQARAVAGHEAVPAAESIALLDPTAAPGLSLSGAASLVVNGRIVDNSTANPALLVQGGQVEAADYQIAGPAVSGSVNLYPGSSGRLTLNHPLAPDPLINLPVPASAASTANNTATPSSPGWNTQALGSPWIRDGGAGGLVSPNHVDGDGTVQLFPGVYQSITITGGSVNLNPGVYVLSPSAGTAYALDVRGGNVRGSGVLLYNTGGDFVPSTGYPDTGDASLYDPGPSGMNAPPATAALQGNFAGLRLDASNNNSIMLSALNDNGGPFSGMLVYQRRANAQAIELTGGNLSLSGTVYARWAPLVFSGGGTYQAQFIVGRMEVSGDAALALAPHASFGVANEVFLVE